jgi:hypothetical protein
VSEIQRVYHNANGIRRTVFADPDRPEEFTIKVEQDLEDILDGVQRKRENHKTGITDNKVLGTIPFIVAEDLKRRGIWDDDAAFRKWLNSWEARPFRVWEGRI